MTTADLETLRLELERLRSRGPEPSSRREYDRAVDALLDAWTKYMNHEIDTGDVDDAVERVARLRGNR